MSVANVGRAMRLLVLLLLLTSAARAAPDDLTNWHGARWGMTASELADVFGEELKPLPVRWDFGSAYADQALFNGAFTVYFQMNKASGRLQQVLLERRAGEAMPAAFESVQEALTSAYGPAEGPCVERQPDGALLRASWRWRFPTTTVQVTWLDFLTTSIIFDDSEAESRRINRRFLPRRLLIRFYPSARQDLDRWENCEEPGEHPSASNKALP